MSTIQLNSFNVDLGDIIEVCILDTTKFKVQFKEYEQFETFVNLRGIGMIRVSKEKAKELVALGFEVKLPNGQTAKGKGK